MAHRVPTPGVETTLLCITGEVDPSSWEFGSGRGNDRIDSTEAQGLSLSIRPGPGRDEVTGGPADELVYEDLRDPGAADVISTAGEHDYVQSSGPDIIDLGRGRDSLALGRGPDSLGLVSGRYASPGAVLDGGTGWNHLFWLDREPHSWTLDNRAGRITRDGALMAALTGFSGFVVGVRGRFRFVGSDTGEILEAPNPWAPRKWTVDLRMGGGNDSIFFYGGATGSRFDGGTGTDSFRYFPPQHFRRTTLMNLSTGVWRETREEGETSRRILSYEKVFIWSNGPTTIHGTSLPDVLISAGTLEASRVSFYGKAGNDVLEGSDGDDMLVGGPGEDVARGHGGTDSCDAEIRHHCEP
jgi:Ca2+-binding RTX toxin-like protein